MTPIQQLHAEGRIIRGGWSSIDDAGRQLLCLYTAIVGDPEGRPETCPAELCPRWLAHLLPWMDDVGGAEAWPSVVARVVAVAPRLGALRPHVEWQVRAASVREAMRHTDHGVATHACEQAASLCDRRAAGEDVTYEQLTVAKMIGALPPSIMPWENVQAEQAARAACWALDTHGVDNAAALAAATAVSGAWSAVAAEAETAADRLTDTILTLIEADLEAQA